MVLLSVHVTGIFSNCLGESSLETKDGTLTVAVGAENAVKTAANGDYATGADIRNLPYPYNNTVCNEDAVITEEPNNFAVFCNGDGTVDVSGEI